MPQIPHPAIADGEIAIVVLDHRAVNTSIDRATDRQCDGPQLYRQGHSLLFQIAPLVTDAVLCPVIVHDQLVDVHHVRRVDRIGPAQMFVVTQEREGAAREVGAGIMPALVAFDHQFVPGDAAAPWLVAIRYQNGWPA